MLRPPRAYSCARPQFSKGSVISVTDGRLIQAHFKYHIFHTNFMTGRALCIRFLRDHGFRAPLDLSYLLTALIPLTHRTACSSAAHIRRDPARLGVGRQSSRLVWRWQRLRLGRRLRGACARVINSGGVLPPRWRYRDSNRQNATAIGASSFVERSNAYAVGVLSLANGTTRPQLARTAVRTD